MSPEIESIYGTLPSNWRLVNIRGLIQLGFATLQTGPFGTMLHASAYRDLGTPVVAVQHIGQGRLIHLDLPRIDGENVKRLHQYKLQTGDIVLGRKGAIDRRAIITEAEDGWLQGSDCIRLRLSKDLADPFYVLYVLGSTSCKQWIIRNAQGATMPSLNQEIIGRIPIPWPPLEEQRAIASILGSLDDKIELNRRMNATLEATARALFQSWFVDFDPVRAKMDGRQPEGLDAATAALFPDRLVDSALGPIPAGWRVGTLGEVSEKTQYGYTASATDKPIGPKFLRIMDINKSPWIEWDTVPYCEIQEDEVSKYTLQLGDIVIARMADPGHGALIEEDVDAVFASYLIRFRPQDINYARFLQYWLRSAQYWQIVDGFKTGTTRSSLNAQVLSGFKLVVPSISITSAFSTLITAVRDRVVENNRHSRTLAETRDALLPRLLSGEVRMER